MVKARLEAFEKLMSDPRLEKLNELQRGASDVLDLVNLSENQNTDILAWLFDAREGHGQGDAILSDLLLYASKRAIELGCLEKGSETHRFFARWTPARIRTTSFGSAFCVREFGFNRKSRTDLFVIDEQNEFVLVIENKAGTKHSRDQLDRYRKAVVNAVDKNPRIKNYWLAFIGMDWNYDEDNHAASPCSATWMHVGYDWLKTSAERAQSHVERGNASARLVASYCTMCTRWEWEDPIDKRRRKIAADLYHDYPKAAEMIRSYVEPENIESSWFKRKSKSDPTMLFVLQNKATAELLSELSDMAAMAQRVQDLLKLDDDDGIDYRTRWLSVRAPFVENLSKDERWVAFLNVGEATPEATPREEKLYDVSMSLKMRHFRSEDTANEIREKYMGVDAGFSRASIDRACRVSLAKDVGQADALRALQRRFDALQRLMP